MPNTLRQWSLNHNWVFINELEISIYNLITKKYFKNDLNYDYNIKIKDNTDLIIQGLGFINIKKRCKLEVYSKYCDLIEVRKSMF